MSRMVRLSKANENELVFKVPTYYSWKHRNKHPELFVQVGRTLFVDLDQLDQLFEKSRLKKAIRK